MDDADRHGRTGSECRLQIADCRLTERRKWRRMCGELLSGNRPIRGQVRSPVSNVQCLRREEQEVVEAEVTEQDQRLADGEWRMANGGHRPLLLVDQFFDSRDRLGDVLDRVGVAEAQEPVPVLAEAGAGKAATPFSSSSRSAMSSQSMPVPSTFGNGVERALRQLAAESRVCRTDP